MKKSRRSLICSAVFVFCSFLLGLYCAVTVLLFTARLLGYQKFVVVSGSMAPAIPVGACILVREKEPEKIKSGEILTFSINEGRTIVTHRVLENQQEQSSFLTKGDANDCADGSAVSYKDSIGTVSFILPLLGFLLVFLNSIYGKMAAASLFLLCIWLLPWIRTFERRKHGKRKKNVSAADCCDDHHSFGNIGRRGICIFKCTDRSASECDHHRSN